MAVSFHKLMKDKNTHFQETQWITSRINANYAYLHHREIAENPRDELKIIQREKMDYLQRNEKVVSWHLNNRNQEAGHTILSWEENLWT